MGRARQNFTGRLRLAPAAVMGIALALVGCSAGQIAQTAGMEPAINGGIGQAGTIAIRNVQLAYPQGGAYPQGASAVLLGTIVNTGQTDDELVSARTPVADIAITGDRALPAGRTLVAEVVDVKATSSSVTTTSSPTSVASTSTPSSGSESPTAPSSQAPSNSVATTTAKPASIGKITLVLTGLAEEIRSGKTVEVTFIFRSGQATVAVPVAVPTTPREAPAHETP